MKLLLKILIGGFLALILMGGCVAVIVGSSGDTPTDDPSSADTGPAVPELLDRMDEGENLSSGEENARRSAEQYLEISGFSKQGLIRQLTSEAEGYALPDARRAVNSLDVDWNEQAARSAEQYLETGPFSRDGMIQQLSSEAEGYTLAQATYGADQVGLE